MWSCWFNDWPCVLSNQTHAKVTWLLISLYLSERGGNLSPVTSKACLMSFRTVKPFTSKHWVLNWHTHSGSGGRQTDWQTDGQTVKSRQVGRQAGRKAGSSKRTMVWKEDFDTFMAIEMTFFLPEGPGFTNKALHHMGTNKVLHYMFACVCMRMCVCV